MQMDTQILGAIIGAVAIIVSGFIGALIRPESFTTLAFWLRGKRRLSWAKVERGLNEIISEMHSVGFDPDIIITVAGSGGIMANWLYKSRNRDIPTYTTLQEPKNNRWDNIPSGHCSIEGNRWVIHIPEFLKPLSKGKRVLILDSGYATGETALSIRNHLSEAGSAELKYACLVYVKNVGPQTIKPDFYAYEFESSNFWYPWGKAS